MSSPAHQRRRRRILSWIPIGIVGLICVGFIVAANLIQGSWWADDEPIASTDQTSPRGMSMFTQTGVDYLTRDGFVKIEVRDGSEPADALGLPEDGTRRIEPIVPVQAILLGVDGVIDIDLVRSITLETSDGRLSAVEISTDNDGTWTGSFAEVIDVASEWGFGAEELESLRSDMERPSDDTGLQQAALSEREYNGARVTAAITVHGDEGFVTATFTIRPL